MTNFLLQNAEDAPNDLLKGAKSVMTAIRTLSITYVCAYMYAELLRESVVDRVEGQPLVAPSRERAKRELKLLPKAAIEPRPVVPLAWEDIGGSSTALAMAAANGQSDHFECLLRDVGMTDGHDLASESALTRNSDARTGGLSPRASIET